MCMVLLPNTQPNPKKQLESDQLYFLGNDGVGGWIARAKKKREVPSPSRL